MKKLTAILAALYCLVVLAACATGQEDIQSKTQSGVGAGSSIAASSGSASRSTPASSSSSRSTTGSSSWSIDASSDQSQSAGAPSPSQSRDKSPAQPSGGAASPAPSSQSPAPTPAPPAPAPSSSKPEPAPEPPPPPQPSGPYAYPFDIGQIQNDMVAWGQAVGMVHEPDARTPNSSSWNDPITASEGFQGDILKAKLQEYVQFYTSASWQSYGNDPVTQFTIYVSGTTFYVLH